MSATRDLPDLPREGIETAVRNTWRKVLGVERVLTAARKREILAVSPRF